jgi:large repetitive protein
VGLYLSTDAVITTADARIGTRYLSSLSGGTVSSANTSVTLPTSLAAGTYYIGAIADYSNTVKTESSETNNALTGNTVVFTIGADLVMSSVSAPASAVRGTSVGITDAVMNQGVGKSGSFYVGLYLSTDANITTADLRISRRSVGSLAAGAASSATTSVTIPTTFTVGTYYVGAIADYTNTAKENNETNNARAGNTLVVQ